MHLRFAVISDPHVALPETIWPIDNRFHLVEVSIPALEQILDHLCRLDLDFLLLPGDLSQHGERVNHQWLAQRLKSLPFPVYGVLGNHDVLVQQGNAHTLSLAEFPQQYRALGYDSNCPYYCQPLAAGIHLIGLNSIGFDPQGQQLRVGYIDPAQLAWLETTLASLSDSLVMVMVHHNVLEHLPGQAVSPLGQRYLVGNRQSLLEILHRYGVQLIFTGHLHVQDIAQQGGLYDITTGSLVSYPHPYRLIELTQPESGPLQLTIETHYVTTVPGWPDLQTSSRQWMCDRADPFMTKLLTTPPLNLPAAEAATVVPHLKEFWATIAAGDPHVDFSHLPAKPRRYLEQFNALGPDGQPQYRDNHTTLTLE